jgi:hypothetical protein
LPDKPYFMIRTILTPDTQTVTLTVPRDYVGKELEIIDFSKKEGLRQMKKSEFLSPALKENPLSNEEFVEWIEKADAKPGIGLKEAKNKWAKKREQLKQLIK